MALVILMSSENIMLRRYVETTIIGKSLPQDSSPISLLLPTLEYTDRDGEL